MPQPLFTRLVSRHFPHYSLASVLAMLLSGCGAADDSAVTTPEVAIDEVSQAQREPSPGVSCRK